MNLVFAQVADEILNLPSHMDPFSLSHDLNRG